MHFSCAFCLCYTDRKISVFSPFPCIETKLFLHFRFYADWQPAGQHGYSIQVCLQLPEGTPALPKVYLNNLHTSHIPHLYIKDDIIIFLMKITKGLLAGARDLVAYEATTIQDNHVLVKDQP